MLRELCYNRERRVFQEKSGRAVPQAAEMAVLRENSMGKPIALPASNAEVTTFASTPVGKDLVS